MERIKKLIERSLSARFLLWLTLLNWVDLAAVSLPSRREAKKKLRVLFVRVDAIGDFVLWTSTFEVFDAIYPADRYERIFIGPTDCTAFGGNTGFFDKTIFYNRSRLVTSIRYRFASMRQVRLLSADVVINPTLSRDFLWADSIVRCSRASERIGSVGLANRMNSLQKAISDRWYTRLIEAPKPSEHLLTSEYNFAVALLPDGAALPGVRPPHIIPLVESPVSGNYAVLFLGARFAYRRWPVDRFAQIARHLRDVYALQVVISGGPGEEHLAAEFGAHYESEFIDLVGKTSLDEFAALLARAKLLVTNDTAAGHIAAAVNCLTVIVNPGAQDNRYFPYPEPIRKAGLRQAAVIYPMPCFGCYWNCIFTDLPPTAPKPCIDNISVDDVTNAIAEVMVPAIEPVGA